MLQSPICGRFLLLAAVASFAVPGTCWGADPPATAPTAAADELAFLLKKIHTAHDAVSSGEFLAAEVIEDEAEDGVQRRVFNEVRGVFDLNRGRRRHELRRMRIARAPLERCLVVETEAGQALWDNSGMIQLFPKTHAYFSDEQKPVDPLALGFLGPIAEPQSFAEFEEFLAKHAAKGHVSVRREPEGYLLSIEIPLVPRDLLEKVPPRTTATRLRRTTINASLGFVPTRTTISFLDKNGKDTEHPATVDVTWEKRGEVAVPVVVRTYWDLPKLWEERRTIKFTWKSVNQRISDDEFNYKKFPVPVGTFVFDNRQHPPRGIGRIGE